MKDGQPSVCIPTPAIVACERPYHDRQDRNGGGPHGAPSALPDINGGKMNGFIAQGGSGAERLPQSPQPYLHQLQRTRRRISKL